jgi:membrane associated rhomboid family serine protease
VNASLVTGADGTSGHEPEVPTLELHFRPASARAGQKFLWGLALGAGVVGAFMGLRLLGIFTSLRSSAGIDLRVLLGSMLLASCAATVAALRARAQPKSMLPLRAYATHLELPQKAGSARTHRVDYGDILSLNVAGREPRAMLFLGTAKRLLGYRLNSFVERDAFGRLQAEIRQRLEQQRGGDELLARMDRREAIGQAAWATRPLATFVLLGSVVLGFGVMELGGATLTPLGLIEYGANAPALVAEGQWFRLFAANFLHANALHLYMNGLGLWALGSLLERLMGPWRLSSIYLLSALGGSLASTLAAQAAFSVGASTAIFGLLGAMAVVNWRFGSELPGGFRQPRRWWIFILGVNGALPLLVPQIDVAAHVGGFATGALATFLLCARPESIQPRRPTPRLIQLFACALMLVFGLALAQAVAHGLGDHPEDRAAVERALASDRESDPDGLNAIAWQYAISEQATPAELELARVAAERAQALAPEEIEIKDTLATVYYRLGDWDRAIMLERQVLEQDDKAFFQSQVARFLEARLIQRGPLEIGPAAHAARLELGPAPGAASASELLLRTQSAYPEGAVLWALAQRNGELQGALIIRLGASAGPAEHRFVPEDAPELEGTRLELALVDASGCDACAAGSARAQFVEMDPAALELP